MRPLLGKPISFRISEREYGDYTRAAADLGIGLSEYLRLRLVSVGEDYVADQIAQLRLTLIDTASTADQDMATMLTEVLLIMRQICKPSDLNSVRAELHRLGVTPWSPALTRTD